MIMWSGILLINVIQIGLQDTWRGWTQECISTTFSVLVSGSLSKLFKAFTGIWKGDTLSPFLFMIVVEALSSLLVSK